MIEPLEWDSHFFGHRIGKLKYTNASKSLPTDDYFKDFDLVYIFSDVKLNNEYHLVDIKVTFEKTTISKSISKHIDHFDSNKHSYKELLGLVYLSGHDSRFLKDPFFGERAFKKLYKTWIDNSLVDSSVTILVYRKDNKIIGFVSFKEKGGNGHIELIAVASEARGQGVGEKLLNAVENKLGPEKKLTVPTQETNLKACYFYTKNKFKIKTKQYIYHYAVDSL